MSDLEAFEKWFKDVENVLLRDLPVDLVDEFKELCEIAYDKGWQAARATDSEAVPSHKEFILKMADASKLPSFDDVYEHYERTMIDCVNSESKSKAAMLGVSLRVLDIFDKYQALTHPPAKPESQEACSWWKDMDDWDGATWDAECGAYWVFIDGGPTENLMKYCPQCGKQVKVLPTNQESGDE